MRAAAILIFDKCLSPRQTMANNYKTVFSLHVVKSASDDCNFYTVFQKKFTLLLVAITKSDVDRFQ